MNLKKIVFVGFFILLIVSAAIAGILFMSGTLASMTSNSSISQEKLAIPNVRFIAGSESVNDTLNLSTANVGAVQVTIMGCILKDGMGNVVTFVELASQPVIEKGTFEIITLALNKDTLIDGTHYTLTVASTMGSSFVSPAFDRSSTEEYDPLKDSDLQSILQKSLNSTPPPQGTSLFQPVYLPVPTPVIIGSIIVAVFSVMGAYKLSQHIVDSKNTKDRYIVFFFVSVIFVSIIVWVVSAIWFPMTATL